jgi:Fe-S oxidoreductase
MMLKDYATIFASKDRERASILAEKVRHISEIVARDQRPASTASATASSVTYHSSCHLRAAGVSTEPREVLRRLPGTRYVEMADADRCAGGAGTFLVKNPDLSQRIFERKRRAIAASGASVVATSCPACMIRLRTGLRDDVRVAHVAQLADEAERLPPINGL